jgi:hypothetical protein
LRKRYSVAHACVRPTLLDKWDRNSIKMKKLTEITSEEANVLVIAKATYYPDSVRIYIPNEPYSHRKEGFEGHKRPSQLPMEKEETAEELIPYETNEERSVRRTRKALKDYVLCNEFDIFCTSTIAEDRHNDQRSINRFSTWFKNQRNRNGKFRYIGVLERHKDGALHFHALIGGYTGKLQYAYNPNTREVILDKRHNPIYNFTEYKLGHTTAKIIDSKEGKTKTAFYLQKYIGKDLSAEFGKNRYWASKGLKKPYVEDNPEPFYKHVDTRLHWVLDHGTILEFEYGRDPVIDSFIEAHRQ